MMKDRRQAALRPLNADFERATIGQADRKGTSHNHQHYAASVKDFTPLLEEQRRVEQQFALDVSANPDDGTGWPATVLIRNSYSHPRYHLAEHFAERGDNQKATELLEATLTGLRRADAPGHTIAAALYNLATMRVRAGRNDDAHALIEEAIPLRGDVREMAATDPELASLRKDDRFEALIRS
jgi:hypothetical protein